LPAPAKGGVRIRVRVAPRAAANRVAGIAADGAGGRLLKLQVTAPPDGGKANKAVIALLAGEWKVAKSAIDIVRGKTERTKTLIVSGDAEELTARLIEWAKDQKHE